MTQPFSPDAHASFLAPRLSPESLDRWLIRSRILEAVTREVPEMHGTLVDLGCGRQPYRSLVSSPPSRVERYVGVDVPSDRYDTRDVSWDGVTIPLSDRSADYVLATELLEHCPDPQRVMDEVARILKPGGRLLLTVPFLWPLHETPYDEYRYTPFALDRMLSAAGFVDIDLRPLGGWDASLAQMLGLWARRRPMSARKRDWVSRVLTPVVRRLAAGDRLPEQFREGVMITGLAGTAIRGKGA